MLFQPKLIEQIVRGLKTQTRRPVKPEHKYTQGLGVYTEVEGRLRPHLVYGLYSTLAVQPGRGEHGVLWNRSNGDWTTIRTNNPDYVKLKIRITDIRADDVRKITEADARAEGFEGHHPRHLFWETWCGMYDEHVRFARRDYTATCWEKGVLHVANNQDELSEMLIKTRPDDLYTAWAITFEVV